MTEVLLYFSNLGWGTLPPLEDAIDTGMSTTKRELAMYVSRKGLMPCCSKLCTKNDAATQITATVKTKQMPWACSRCLALHSDPELLAAGMICCTTSQCFSCSLH